MNIPFIDLKTQFQQNRTQISDAVQAVLEHGQYIMGPEVGELEARLAEYVGVKHVLACSSGTDALVLPLMQQKLCSEDAIFTTPFTFFASAESISLAGATPVFVDIDAETYNLSASELERQIQKTLDEGKLTPKGIIPVDLFGLAADYDQINKIAEKYGLFVIEDAAQAFGAPYHGRRAGSLASIAATSFYPAKPLGGYGDSGAIFTDDSALYEEYVSLRVHGQATSGDKYDNVRIGLNARMDSIQAAVLIEKLKLYDEEIGLRNQIAARYSERLDGFVKTPAVPSGQGCVWAQYSIEASNREQIIAALKESGIPTAVFYPIPIHLSTAYKYLAHQVGDFPISEAASKRIFSLPMHPYLTENQINDISEIIRKTAIK